MKRALLALALLGSAAHADWFLVNGKLVWVAPIAAAAPSPAPAPRLLKDDSAATDAALARAKALLAEQERKDAAGRAALEAWAAQAFKTSETKK